MLEGVQIFCFAASYTVALALEASRLVLRAPIRYFVMLGFAIAGVIAQVLYLAGHARTAGEGAPLSNWHDWLLAAALFVATVYVVLAAWRPQATLGIFMLPAVLVLIGAAYVLRDSAPFARQQALQIWGIIHGATLLVGAVAGILGFLAGLMYLVQGYRLKHKLLPRRGLQLPSLEWLQQVNEGAFIGSACFLIAGLAAGVVLNLIQLASGRAPVPWTDPVVLVSAALFAWLATALLFNLLYRPARQGQKVAYLTVANCVVLALVLSLVMLSQSEHARGAPPAAASRALVPQRLAVGPPPTGGHA